MPDILTLSLIKIIDKNGKVSYHAVNDRHYDAMLASPLNEQEFGTWEWLGDVHITEEILNEQGLYFNG